MRKTLSKRHGAFTLIELMIVVAIIGILAAIAIPNFVRFQLRSKSSEGKTNLAGIRTSEESYFAEYGTYINATASPAALPTPHSSKQGFVNVMGVGAGFDQIGWQPEGQVYFQYDVVRGAASDYTAGASADIDANNVNQRWSYARTSNGTPPVQPAANLCLGAYDPNAPSANGSLPNQVGPCDATSGQSVF